MAAVCFAKFTTVDAPSAETTPRTPSRLLTIVFILLSAALGPAQQPPPRAPIPTLKTTARIVVLDVVVTDKQGQLVKALARDDFNILEDKVPQAIQSFEPPSLHLLPAAANSEAIVNSAADLGKIGDAPVNILVLDELNTRFEDMSFARNSMVKYLTAQPRILRQPTVLLLATNTKFVQMHEYTQDRDALIADIRQRIPEYPWRMMRSGKQGSGAVERMAQSLASLEQIAQSSSGTPGRKNIIWIGVGFPSADLSGLDIKTADTIQAAIRQVANMLLAARITMYTINTTINTTTTVALETPDDLVSAANENGADPFAGAVQFSTFAPATGGRAFVSRNDIDNEIAEGINAGAVYYTLSYSPSNRSDDAVQYRHIRIVMKDPSLHATTRDGYFPPGASPIATINPSESRREIEKQTTAQLQLDLSNALTSTISYNGLAITASKTSNGAYIVSAAGHSMTWRAANSAASPASEIAEATVAAAWYSANGKLLGHVARELVATRSVETASPATFTLPVTLPADVARLRFVVRDAISGRIGTADLTSF